MNIRLISDYINRMTKDDLRKIALSQGIILDDYEVDNIYDYVKNNYKKYLYTKINYEDILDDLKSMLSSSNFDKVMDIYTKYKDKI